MTSNFTLREHRLCLMSDIPVILLRYSRIKQSHYNADFLLDGDQIHILAITVTDGFNIKFDNSIIL